VPLWDFLQGRSEGGPSRDEKEKYRQHREHDFVAPIRPGERKGGGEGRRDGLRKVGKGGRATGNVRPRLPKEGAQNERKDEKKGRRTESSH